MIKTWIYTTIGFVMFFAGLAVRSLNGGKDYANTLIFLALIIWAALIIIGINKSSLNEAKKRIKIFVVFENGNAAEAYIDIEKAIKCALIRVDLLQKHWDDAHKEDEILLAKRWLPTPSRGNTIKRWSNGQDDIEIIVYDLK